MSVISSASSPFSITLLSFQLPSFPLSFNYCGCVKFLSCLWMLVPGNVCFVGSFFNSHWLFVSIISPMLEVFCAGCSVLVSSDTCDTSCPPSSFCCHVVPCFTTCAHDSALVGVLEGIVDLRCGHSLEW
jgi:hypothetical protein